MNKFESGNVIFYVLIAVALLAALSFVVAQSGRGGISNLSREQANIAASGVIEYGNTLATAVSQLRLRGYKSTDISFENASSLGYANGDCTESACKVFDMNGGGIVWQALADDAAEGAGAAWQITGDMTVEDVGTSCSADACADLLAVALNIKQDVCKAINKRLGVDAPDVVPVDGDASFTKFTGGYDYTISLADEAGSQKLAGRSAGCVYSTADALYFYYQVLIQR